MTDKKKYTAPVAKDDLVTVTITDMSENGEGIGKTEGFALFIKDAVTGDRVRAKVISVKKGYGYARLMEILEPSKDRVQPRCPAAAPCGGCQLQSMSYEAQLKFKTEKVKNHLSRIGHLPQVPVLDTLGMNAGQEKDADAGQKQSRNTEQKAAAEQGPWHYRNKAQYPVRQGKDGQIKIGFYAGRTHAIIETPCCYIGQPVNEEIIAIIRKWMEDYKIPAYNETTGRGVLRHIMIRTGYFTGEIMVCLVINERKLKVPAAQKELVNRLLQIKGMTSICLNINTEKTNVILGDQMVNLAGPGYITDMIGDIRYQISAQSFFQVNPIQTRVLYETALDFAGLTGQETVWDLYCGTGTISLFLARRARQVYGVEIVPPAIDNARINAENNGIDNVKFYVGKAEEVLPKLYETEGIHADVIVTDPPRKGCEEIVLETMVRMAPKRIVYVSCNSSTLARDLHYLSERGYETVKVQPVDMFAHTTGVECVSLLVRR
ncbi:MAG: 23S rRNA (uracil(1939)-C(5))-methyltransferase RlmD [Lachnospiraceae bacterium]|nr:23S rRNA (uracil(1939)-C(5))-methyltransferase RlmD [Lachnospiraceae bacterium]MDY4970137.1 23S rRNA (uracil(1939)-C(5))-methyltransferase RlmD [Lachnospiraceae bacterium]